MNTEKITNFSHEYSPTGNPHLVMTPEFRRGNDYWVNSGHTSVNPYLPVQFQVSDSSYIGPIATISSKTTSLRRGEPFENLFTYTFYDRRKRQLAKVNTINEGAVEVYDAFLTPKEIADALVSVQSALQEGQATRYKAHGLYQSVSIDEAMAKNLPRNQYISDERGTLLINPGTRNVNIIKGKFSYKY